tara:strand:- start:478 stop:774 length:297 start_codon:yes stop_codon:yes gene_type:complete
LYAYFLAGHGGGRDFDRSLSANKLSSTRSAIQSAFPPVSQGIRDPVESFAKDDLRRNLARDVLDFRCVFLPSAAPVTTATLTMSWFRFYWPNPFFDEM